MLVKAHGVVHHHFPGGETVVLAFDSELAAQAAFSALQNDNWKTGKSNKTLYFHAEHGRLTALKAQFKSAGFTLKIDRCGWDHCYRQCEDAEIDGLPHSIDAGPLFTLEIECQDPRQVSMFGETQE